MVQVHSTWFPLVERNPQTFVDIARAKEVDLQKATQRVCRSTEMPSRLIAQTLPGRVTMRIFLAGKYRRH